MVILGFDNGSTAYDLSLFESKSRKKENVVRLVPKKRKQQKKKAKSLTAFVTSISAVATVAVVSLFIYGQIQLFEFTEEISLLKKQLLESQSAYTQLEMRLASELSLKDVESKARERLQMDKVSPGQIEYIDMSKGDKVVVSESGGGSWFHNFLKLFS